MTYNRYRINVNESLLDSFYAKPKDQATNKELNEVNKVITIVLNHYYAKYYRIFKELRAWAMLAILERHQNYDPAWRSYNFIYRISRNEIGNKISKYMKEEYVDEIPEYGEYKLETRPLESVEELLPYLSGDRSFKVIEVDTEMIVPLLAFVEETLNPSSQDITYMSIANLLAQLNYE